MISKTDIPPADRLITVKEAARLVGKSTHSIHFRIRKNQLRRFRERHNKFNQVYVDKEELLKIYDAKQEFVLDPVDETW